MTGFFVTDEARADIDRHTQWLFEEAGSDVALRFAIQATTTFEKLADNVGLGSPVPAADARVGAVRKWKVANFPKMLIFYRLRNQTVEIIRLFHATQDWLARLDAH